MQSENCNCILVHEKRYMKEATPIQSDSYYSLYFANDVETKEEVLWVDINIEGSKEADMNSYMQNALSCIANNPQLFVTFFDYWISDDCKILTIITEKPALGCVTDLIKNTSENSKFDGDHDYYISLVHKWLLSLLIMMDVLQKNNPPILMSSLSNNSIYFGETYETIKFALFPVVFNSGLSNSFDMLRYLPLESINNQIINESTVMYSLGVCLYEMLTKSNMFACNDLETMLQLKANKNYMPIEISSIDDRFFKDIVIRLLVPSGDRPSCQSILHELQYINTDLYPFIQPSINSVRNFKPTVQAQMKMKSNPSSLRNSIAIDKEENDLFNYDNSIIPEFDNLGTACPVDFCKLNLTFDLSETGSDYLNEEKDHVVISIVSRIDCILKMKITRIRGYGDLKSTFYLLLKYGETPISKFISQLSELNLVPEIMIEGVTENVELWLDNFVKNEFAHS